MPKSPNWRQHCYRHSNDRRALQKLNHPKPSLTLNLNLITFNYTALFLITYPRCNPVEAPWLGSFNHQPHDARYLLIIQIKLLFLFQSNNIYIYTHINKSLTKYEVAANTNPPKNPSNPPKNGMHIPTNPTIAVTYISIDQYSNSNFISLIF